MNHKFGNAARVLAASLVMAVSLQTLAVGQQADPASPPPSTQNPDDPSAIQPPSQTPQPETQVPANSNGASSELPDSPGASQAQPNPNTPAASPTPSQSPSSGPLREPEGTAAAETVPTTGVAASRPAGAALAPAKQRRVRSILIKVGALVGAGAAIGTVYALSQGSPSKPPGSR